MGAVQDHFNADGFKGYYSEFNRYESWYGKAMDMAIEALLDDGTLVVNVKEGKTWQSIVIRAFDRMLENYDGSQNWQTAETKTCYD